MENFSFSPNRYQRMKYRRCGISGLQLPLLSLGLWSGFGEHKTVNEMEQLIYTAFDNGITYFDLADNYGPPSGCAEKNFGRILKRGFNHHRDEIIISSKAGCKTWEGPYGIANSKKHLKASIDHTLENMGIDYLDIFYSHLTDTNVPLEETMETLVDMIHAGKTLYIGLSNYSNREYKEATRILKEMGVKPIAYQGIYSMFTRDVETQILKTSENLGIGFTAQSPLAQGILSCKYLIGTKYNFTENETSLLFTPQQLNQERITIAHHLNLLAKKRNQTLSQLALTWLLQDTRVTTVIVGANHCKQLIEYIKTIDNSFLDSDEIEEINNTLSSSFY